MKFVGVDYGLARTGLAVSDPEGRLAFPLMTLRLEDFSDRKAFVVGLPLTLDGEESLTTRQIRNVTERLKRRVSLPFFFMMEALSSQEAWSDLREAGLKMRKRKAVLDQQAAVRILSSFLSLAPQDRSPA